MGMATKLFVFFIILNSLVMFAGNAGMFGTAVNTSRSQEFITSLQESINNVLGQTEAESSGIQILEFFNPLNYAWVLDFILMSKEFFLNPLYLFNTLPAPFSYMFTTLFGLLEIIAVAGFIRGFTP